MRLDRRGQLWTLVVLCVIMASTLVARTGTLSGALQTPPNPLLIYLEDGPYVVTPIERDGVAYLQLDDLLQRLALPYTDATATGLFTIQGRTRVLALERDTGRITLGGREVRLGAPPLHEDGRWLVPVDFLPGGIGELLGISFDTRGSRMIASNVQVTSLAMNAEAADGMTRLMLRLDAVSNVRVQQDLDENLVTLNIDRVPVIPQTASLDYRDTLIRSVSFDDSDGLSQVVVTTTPQVANLRLIPGDGNRTFVLELVPAEAPQPLPAAALPAPDAGRIDPPAPISVGIGPVRTVAIDPGHGGLDSGTGAAGALEKDLTLLLARRLQATLEERLNTAVILTRERDIAVATDSRSAIANQVRADVFISLHIGFSPDAAESRTTVFVMGDPVPGITPANTGVFIPWYTAYLISRSASVTLAESLVDNLSARIPEWPVAVGSAPLAVLASATMPAVVAELGNANNPADVERLSDPAFQNRLIDAIVDAVQAGDSSEAGREN